jgi:hypothetical protein
MAFSVPLSSSPPSTPDKSRSLASNPSTTPAGPPPSSAASFTPQGPPPSSVFGSSRIGSRSKLNFSQSAFSQSGNFDPSESFGSSFASSNYPLPGTKTGKAGNAFGSSLFSATNGSNFGGFGSRGPNLSRMSEQTEDYEGPEEEAEEYDEEEEEEQDEEDEEDGDEDEEDAEEEDGDDDMDDVETTNNTSAPRFGFFDSQFRNSPPRSTSTSQQKFIYSNPNNAKRAKLDERWATSSPAAATKLKLDPRRKPSQLPSIVRDLASRSSRAAVTEPDDMIIDTEDQIGELYDKTRDAEYREIDLPATLSEVSTALTAIWDSCAARERDAAGPYRAAGGIGPGESATGIEKASFLTSLLLPLYQPPLVNVSAGPRSSAIRATSRSLVLSGPNAKTYVATPKVLLDWLNGNHHPQTDDAQELRAVSPNPTASPNFWNVIQAAVLRGRFAEVAELLRSADFNYARSALQDGLAQPGYRGAQLQNIQKSVNKAIQLLESSPLVQYDDWDVTGVEWAAYRKRVNSALLELEEFAEGQDPHTSQSTAGGAPRFQAANFRISQGPSAAQNGFSFAQSARMAESRVPWSIYQSLKGIYGIILGQIPAIMTQARDWVEATIGLTAWWDGEDDGDVFEQSANGFGMSTTSNKSSKIKSQLPRSVDANRQDAYIRRLDYSFGAVTDDASGTGYQLNTLNSLEVGLASVFEGNVESVLQLLQTWSLGVASAVAEVATSGGWWDTSAGKKSLSGFLSENDLMVLSYGQDGNVSGRLRKDDILTAYAEGLFRRPKLRNDTGVREGWELALEVLSRLDDANTMRKMVSELLDRLPLDNIDRVDKVVLLCTDLGLENEGRKISEVCSNFCPG